MTTPLNKNCITIHKKPIFVISENRSRVDFTNPQLKVINEVKIDDCIIISGVRCDYLLDIPCSGLSILIELKGRNVKHAISQIEASHNHLSNQLGMNIIWIVSSKRCPIIASDLQIAALKIKRMYNAVLIVKNSPVKHAI